MSERVHCRGHDGLMLNECPGVEPAACGKKHGWEPSDFSESCVFCELDRLEAEIVRCDIEGHNKPPAYVPTEEEMSAAWPPADVVSRLADGVAHLLHDHGCDTHGYEELGRCVTEGRALAARMRGKG